MSFNLDRQDITQFFIDNLTDINLRFEGFDYKDQTLPFVGILIDPLKRENITVDNLVQAVDGLIRVRIFTEANNGTKEMLDLCDQVAGIIDNQTIESIVTFATDAPKELNTEDAYMAKEITVPYFSVN